MPDEGLLQSLEALLARYSQQKKTSSSLVSSMKAVSGSLNKATRALNDYTSHQQGDQLPTIAQAQTVFGSLRLQEETIQPLMDDMRREFKALASLEAALRDTLTALGGDSVDVIRLDRGVKALQTATRADEQISALMPQLEQELQYGQSRLGTTFGESLRDALAEQGIEIGGRPPRFEIGRFEVQANFVTRAASISYGKDVTTRRVPLSVDAVLRAYQRDKKAVMGRNEDGERWIAQLYEAVENVRRKRGLSSRRANIIDCYVELAMLRQPRTFRSEPSKQGFRDYTRAQFAYDFFAFTNEQRLSHEGMYVEAHNATKSHAENAARSIWIVEGKTPHEGRYIGDIEFSAGGA